LAAAAKMLVATDLRVREIALLCGYPIASHFATVFSARYGTPPWSSGPQGPRRTGIEHGRRPPVIVIYFGRHSTL
jgi:transcriptional regulator GlxA family with amidase domain